MNLRWPVYYGYRNKKVVWFTIEEEVLYEKVLVGIRKLINMQIDEYLELLCSNIGLN